MILEKLLFRHELKYYINLSDWMQLRQRLSLIAKPDPHADKYGRYNIRSLYFDNYADKAVFEKLSGQSIREKYRIRYYNDNLDYINLEKKSKRARMTNKQKAKLTKEQCTDLLNGNLQFMLDSGNELLQELYQKMFTQQLRPKTIVDYNREAYVYGPGNVRITIDSNVRMSNDVKPFLYADSVTIPAAAGTIILEVKFDEFLPDIIRDIIQIDNRSSTEFSKYVVSRFV